MSLCPYIDQLAHFIADSLSSSYRVSRATNGRDGLEQALEQLPDLVISDVLMPDLAGPEMDGLTLCSNLKTVIGFNSLCQLIHEYLDYHFLL